MTNLVFLEAATQSDSAAEIIESNEALINFATAEVDSLVEEQALHTAWHVGAFVEESFDITYENMTDPISDIVVEATSIFADVIASDDLSDSEKKELIEGYAHIIAMGDLDSWEEASDYEKRINALATASSKSKLVGIGAVAGGISGSIGGAGVANAGASVVSLFSKERKAWKSLIKQEKQARKTGANESTMKKIHIAKNKARDAYFGMRHDKKVKYAKRGAVIGGVVGAAHGGVVGSRLHNFIN